MLGNIALLSPFRWLYRFINLEKCFIGICGRFSQEEIHHFEEGWGSTSMCDGFIRDENYGKLNSVQWNILNARGKLCRGIRSWWCNFITLMVIFGAHYKYERVAPSRVVASHYLSPLRCPMVYLSSTPLNCTMVWPNNFNLQHKTRQGNSEF